MLGNHGELHLNLKDFFVFVDIFPSKDEKRFSNYNRRLSLLTLLACIIKYKTVFRFISDLEKNLSLL